MTEGWRSVRLGDVAELNGGYAFKSSQYTDEGHFVLRTVNIRDDYSITREGATYISLEEAKEYKRFQLQDKDTLFVMVAATLGKVGYVRQDALPALLNQNMWVIRARPGSIEPDYLQFCFRELSKIPLSWVSGSARSFLRRDDVRNLEFLLPPISEQRAIAATLGALDDKIELNRQMNETLEAMARALFRDWFVDFGPTRAKMEGRDPTLAPDLWALFPDRLDDEGKPEGWTNSAVSSLTRRVTKGTTPTKQDISGAQDVPAVNFLRVNNLTDNSEFVIDNIIKIAPSIHQDVLRRSVLEQDDILYSIAGTIGRVARVANNLLPANANQAIAIIRPDMRCVPPDYLLLWLSDKEFQERLHSKIVQAVQANLSLSMLSDARIIMPAPSTLFALFEFIQTLLNRIEKNLQETRTLAETRDLLLPRLMSGELRVGKVESHLTDMI